MLKVAMCIRGELRTWYQCKDNILNLLGDNFDVDFYFVTWDIDRDVGIDVTNSSLVDEKAILASFRGKNLIQHKIIKTPTRTPPYYHLHEWKMFKSWYECNMLKIAHEHKNDFKYDCVFAIRPDVLLVEHHDKIENDGMEREFNEIASNVMSVMTDCGLQLSTHPPGLHMGDFFFISSSAMSDIICDYYQYLNKPDHDNDEFCVAHVSFTKYLTSKNALITDCSNIFNNALILRPSFEGEIPKPLTFNDVDEIMTHNEKWMHAIKCNKRDRYH